MQPTLFMSAHNTWFAAIMLKGTACSPDLCRQGSTRLRLLCNEDSRVASTAEGVCAPLARRWCRYRCPEQAR